jgi:hypothetical protein
MVSRIKDKVCLAQCLDEGKADWRLHSVAKSGESNIHDHCELGQIEVSSGQPRLCYSVSYCYDKYLRKQPKKRKHLFWPLVSEISFHGWLAVVCWALGRQNIMAEGCDGTKLLISWGPGSRETD